MSDPFWFLENLEAQESKSEQNGTSENEPSGNITDLDGLPLEYASDPKSSEQSKSESIKWEKTRRTSNLGETEKAILDETSVSSEFQNNLLDASNQTNDQGQQQIKITIGSDKTQQPSDGEKDYWGDSTPIEAQSNDSSEKNKNEIVITLSADDIRQGTGEEKQINIDSSALQNGNSVNGEPGKPKIYILLKDGRSSVIGDGTVSNLLGTDNQYCTEVGSTVINLNDFMSPQANQITGNENISTSVNYSGDKTEDGKSKVELVITIKDERKKSPKKPAIQNNPFDLLEESFNPRRQKGKNRRPLKNVNSYSTDASWETRYSKYDKPRSQDEVEWTDETRDTFIRDSDGARCVRTIWSTPNGRRVQTQCYNDDKPEFRRRKPFERFRKNYWTSGIGSLWQDLDNELDRIFASANRMLYF